MMKRRMSVSFRVVPRLPLRLRDGESCRLLPDSPACPSLLNSTSIVQRTLPFGTFGAASRGRDRAAGSSRYGTPCSPRLSGDRGGATSAASARSTRRFGTYRFVLSSLRTGCLT